MRCEIKYDGTLYIRHPTEGEWECATEETFDKLLPVKKGDVVTIAAQQQEPSPHKCHTCRTLQWDNRLIWSLEDLLAWVRANHMDQHDIRNHIDLMLGEYRQELEARQQGPEEKELVTLAFAAWLKKRDELGEIGVTESVTITGEYLGGVYSAGWKQGYEAAIAQAPPKRQSLEQCKNCRLSGSRACMYHGYPESDIPHSCSYKIGEDAVTALHDLDGTFIDVWTVVGHRSKIEAAEARGREDARKEVIEDIAQWIQKHTWGANSGLVRALVYIDVVSKEPLLTFLRNLRSTTPLTDNQIKPTNNNGIPDCCGVNCPDLSQGCKDHCPNGYDHEKATASEQKGDDPK